MTLKTNWQNYYRRFIGTREYFKLSPSHLIFEALEDYFDLYCKDRRVLDVGAGEMTYRFLIKPLAREYITIDKYPAHPDLDIIADAGAMPLQDESFDTVFCSQVLEHSPRPMAVLKEISRVLKKDGIAIITVPHLSYLHGEPEDFFRYTKYGLKELCAEAGLTDLKIIPLGGLLSFIFTPCSILMLSVFGTIPVIGRIVYIINYYLSKLVLFADKKFDKNKVFALNYLGIFKKT